MLTLSVAFVALAVIFLGTCVADVLRADGKLTPARRTRLRVASIFASVAIGLSAVALLLR